MAEVTTRAADFKKLSFALPPENDFYLTLKKRVAAYFETNHLSKNADGRAMAKALILLTALGFFYTLLLSNQVKGGSLIATYIALCLTEILIGFNINHDTNHNAFFKNSQWNHVASYLFDFIGISSFVWKKFHNVAHHTYTNIPGYDGDIERSPFVRMSPQDPLHPIQRYQHIYAPLLLYGFGSINKIFFTDYKEFFLFLKRGIVPKKEIFLFFFFKALNLFLMLGVPLLVIQAPTWQILTGYFCSHFVGGAFMSLVFQLAHLGDELEFPSAEQVKRMTWAEHQLRTTLDFATQSRAVNWLLGGLNFQAVHHLFPYVCHTHYPEIATLVKKTAAEFGVPYYGDLTLFQAIRSHVATLRKFGRGEDKRAERFN